MKNKFLTWILALMLVASVVSAIPAFPVPVSGTASKDGVPLAFVDVKMENLQTRDSIVVTSDENGYFRADWSSLRWYPGSTLKMSIANCLKPECSTTVVMDGNPIRKVTFPLKSSETYPEIVVKFKCWNGAIVVKESDCPVIVVPEKIVCQDGTLVANIESCPIVVPEVICADGSKVIKVESCPVVVPDVICADGSKVAKAEDCPKESNVLTIALGILSGLLAIALGVLAKFKWGKGFVGMAESYKKKGDEEVKKGNLELAKKHYLRAAKMLSSAMKKEQEEIDGKISKL